MHVCMCPCAHTCACVCMKGREAESRGGGESTNQHRSTRIKLNLQRFPRPLENGLKVSEHVSSNCCLIWAIRAILKVFQARTQQSYPGPSAAVDRNQDWKWRKDLSESCACGAGPVAEWLSSCAPLQAAQCFVGSNPGCGHGTAHQTTLRQRPTCHN